MGTESGDGRGIHHAYATRDAGIEICVAVVPVLQSIPIPEVYATRSILHT